MDRQKLTLVICDGFGLSPEVNGNAVVNAPTPNLDKIIAEYPALRLLASGTEVGLDMGEPGNSEVGHLALGTGQIVPQAFQVINAAIRSEEFNRNPALVGAFRELKQHPDQMLHIIGLVSLGGVHGHRDQLIALLALAAACGVKRVAVHAITDGRDSPPKVALQDIKPVIDALKPFSFGRIASVSGRFYAMDRDSRWERVDQAYWALLGKAANHAKTFDAAVEASYAAGLSDETVVPTVITDEKNQPLATIQPHDTVIFANYRPDRARELSTRIIGLATPINFITFTDYFLDAVPKSGSPETTVTSAFELPKPHGTLPEAISQAGLRQIHIAESEKYAHVTYFFGGHQEKKYPLEDWLLVPSPKAPSYDAVPEMSAPAIADAYLQAHAQNLFDVAIINFANMDMVGHTGNYQATLTAVTAVDTQIGRIIANLHAGEWLIITADHGNAEQMIDPLTGEIDKEHTTNPVPFIVRHDSLKADRGMTKQRLSELSTVGMIADVGPTVLDILGIDQPSQMVGSSLWPQLRSQ